MAKGERRAEPSLEVAGPRWVGWVCMLTPDGVVRRKVRLPESLLEQVAVEPAHPPDHRSTVSAQQQLEMMRDDFLEELSRAAREGR